MSPRALGVAALLVLAACSGDATSEPSDATGSARIATTTTSTPVDPATTTSRSEPAATSTTAPPDDSADPTAPTTDAPTETVPPPTVGEPDVATEEVGEFEQPVDLAVRTGDDVLFVVEKTGRIIRFDDGERLVALDITGDVSGGGEQGLLGLAFSPNSPHAYVNYTDRDGVTTIDEFFVADDGTFDTGTGRTVLTVDQPYSNHNAGDLAFGPDDMLYVPLGDGGSGNDPERRSSDPSSLLGSLLRIDPSTGDDEPYGIPPDNPFVAGPLNGIEGAAEVWAWGLRNPWRVAFDPITGDLWIADVGQNELEEVNVVEMTDGSVGGRAADFGWSAFEGDQRFNTDVADPGNTVFPVLTYRHGDDGCSVSGGAPYRGTAIPELEPAYVYGDYCSGKLWALDLAGARNLTLLEGLGQISAVRPGPDGELYVLTLGGPIHRLIPA